MSAVTPAPRGGTRDDIVGEAVLVAAHAWAVACRAVLLEEGRRVSGGWPGTLTEARARAGHAVGRALSARSLPALTNAELGTAAKSTYREARRVWIAEAGR